MNVRYLIRPVLFLIFGLFCLSLAAQKNFVDGYVVLKTGDTLHGKINDRNWEKNPFSIQFQTGQSLQVYRPADLLSFGITEREIYISKVATKDMRPVDISRLEDYPMTDSLVTDTVFLRQLVKGPRLNLFMLADEKEHFYIQSANEDSMHELSFKKYLAENSHNFYEQSLFRNQLTMYVPAGDLAVNLAREIQNTRYDEPGLRRIVRKLNGEQETEWKHAAGTGKTAMTFMLGAGISFMNFRFTGDLSKWTALGFSQSIGQSAGIAADFYGSRNFQKLALRIAVSYSRQVYNGTENRNDFFGKPTRNNYRFEQQSLVPELALLYHFFSKPKLRLYAGLGASYHITSYPQNRYSSTNLETNTETVENDPLEFEKVWLTPNILIGARCWNKVNINCSYIAGGGFVNYSMLGSRMFPISLMLSYVFTAKLPAIHLKLNRTC